MPKPFPKGKSGNPAGRPKGAKNKITYEVAQICADNGCNPFEVLAQISAGTLEVTDEQRKYFGIRLRMEASAELAQYLAPKLKSIEHKGDVTNPINMILNLG
jgi:hypothetical protein